MQKTEQRRRMPTLRAALTAARQAGRPIKSATVDPNGRIRIEFGEPTADTNSNEWDEALDRGKH
jgi:hypothetical protein